LLNLYVKSGAHGKAVSRFERTEMDRLGAQWREHILLYAAEAYFAQERMDRAEELYRQLKDAPADLASVAYQRLFQIARNTTDESGLLALLREAEQALSGRTDVLKVLWRKVGIEAYQAERYDLAEVYFQRVWDLRGTEPISAAVPLYLARLYEQRQDRERAVAVLEEYLELDSGEREEVLYRLANLYLDGQQWSRAAESLGRFRDAFPESELRSKASYRYAYALYRSGRVEDSISVIREVFAAGESGGLTADFLWLQSVLYRAVEQTDAAVQALREYMPLRPEDRRARVEYLKLLFVQRSYQELLREAERMFPDPAALEGQQRSYVQLQYVTGLSHIALKQYEQALQKLNSYTASPRTLEELSGDQDLTVIYPYTLYYRGWAHYRLSEYGRAIELFSSLLEERSDHEFAPRASYLAGWSSYSIGNYAQAEEFLRRTKSLDIGTELAVQTTFLLGQTLSEAGSYEASAVEFRNIFVDYPSSDYADDALFEYAGVLLELGRLNDAVETYRRVYVSYPDSQLAEEAMYTRGEILYENQDFESARNAFFEYRSNFSSGELYDAALYWGGMASYRIGQRSGALLLWEELIDQYRNSPFRSAAMQRAVEVYVEQEEYRKALNTLTDFIAAYPQEASAVGARRQADQLVLVIGGLSETEAQLWVTIDENNRANTDSGREAILELARMTIYEGGTQGVNQNLIAPLLEEVAGKSDADPDAAARARFLMAEQSYRRGDLQRAANLFLGAAETLASDEEFVAEALYRAGEMKHLQEREQEAAAIVEQLQSRFPDSKWTRRASELVGEE
jgi:TolA-binding protein